MSLSSFDRQRLTALEEHLEILYAKLATFEQEITLTNSAPQKFELTQRLKREVVPSIRQYLEEYTGILCKDWKAVVIPEVDASHALEQIGLITQKLQHSQSIQQRDEIVERLVSIQKMLEDSDKAATAKLKLTLPIIPLLASYDMDLDTEAFLVRTWRGVNGLVRRFWK